MKRAVALGFFDGIHIGHGALLERAVSASERLSLTPCVLTYSNHPSKVLAGKSVGLINSPEERAHLISELYNISDIVIKDFTPEYAAMSCEEFFETILIAELSAGYVVAGYDFRFGKGGSGDSEKLKALCEKHGIGCEIVDEVKYGGEAVSSSCIRPLIENGDMEEATKLLGHPHCTISEVLHGKALGNTIGFPTANQVFPTDVIIPRHGVYVSRATFDGKTYRAITNVGVRPTVSDELAARAETHIPGFSGDLYGKIMKTEFVRFLREEKKFSSLSDLVRQISQDVLDAECEN